MMNLLSVQNQLKDLSDRQLAEQMNTGASPQFLVLSEMQRRQKMRQAAGAANEAPKSTVAEEISQAATPGMEQGIAALPMEPPAFADGGIVSFAQGGESKKSKRYTQSGKQPKTEAKKAPGVVRNARGETLEQVLKRLGIDSSYAGFPLEDSYGRINWYTGTREDLLSGSPGSFTMSIGTDPTHREELLPFVTTPRAEYKPTVGPASTKAAPANDQAVTNVIARPALPHDTETSVIPARASAPAGEMRGAGVGGVGSPLAAPAGARGVAGGDMSSGPGLSGAPVRASAPAGETPSAGLQSILDVVAGGSRGVAGGDMSSGGADLSSASARSSAPAGEARGAGVGSLLAAPSGARGVAGGDMSGNAEMSSAPVRASATKASGAGAGVRSLLAAPAARGVDGATGASQGAQSSNDTVYASSAIEEPSDFTLYEGPRPTTLYEIPGVLPPGVYTESQIKEILGESYDAKTQRPLAFADTGSVPKVVRIPGQGVDVPLRDVKLFRDTGWSGLGETYTVQHNGKELEVDKKWAATNFPHAFNPAGVFQPKGGNPVENLLQRAVKSIVPASIPGVTVMDPKDVPPSAIPLTEQRVETRHTPGAVQNTLADTGLTPSGAQLSHALDRKNEGALAYNKNTGKPMTDAEVHAANVAGNAGIVALRTAPVVDPVVKTDNRAVVGTSTPKTGDKPINIQPSPAATTNVLPSAFPMDLKSTMGALSALEPTKYNTDKETALLKKLQDRVDSRKDEPFNMGLMQAGLAMMAGTSPHAMTNMGAGGIKGLEAYAAGKKDLRDLEKEITAAELAMEKAAKDNDWKTYEANASRLAALAGLHQKSEEMANTKVYQGRMAGAAEMGAEAAKASSGRPDNSLRTAQAAALNSDIDYYQKALAPGNGMTIDPQKRIEMETALRTLIAQRDALLGMRTTAAAVPTRPKDAVTPIP